METEEEKNSSFSFQPCGSDPVYQAYFTHMNAGRLKVLLHIYMLNYLISNYFLILLLN